MAPIAVEEFLRQHQAWASIRQIMREELEKRRQEPQDDMLNGIAHAQVDGELIPIDTAINLASTVFLGGWNPLPSNMAWTLRYLTEHPDLRHRLANDPTASPVPSKSFSGSTQWPATGPGRSTTSSSTAPT